MYHLKPIIDQSVVVDLPNCMYAMKSVQLKCEMMQTPAGSCNRNSSNSPIAVADVSENLCKMKNPYTAIEQQVNSMLKNNEAKQMDLLEKRQQQILKQLKELKDELAAMLKALNADDKSVNAPAKETINVTRVQPKPINTKCLQEIVINANPKSIPFSLLAIRKLWQKRLSVRFQVFTHSTIAYQLSDDVVKFNAALAENTAEPSDVTLNIIVIWKPVNQMELICSSATYPIIGETNLLRYLMRIGPNELAHESYGEECAEIDGILDATHLLSKSTQSPKEKLQILKNLNTKLGKQQYFGGTGISITDIAVCSAIRQSVNDSSILKDLPSALQKWWPNVSKIVLTF